MKTPILGGQFVARSVNAADNRMINLYPEIIPEGGKEPGYLSRCPGLLLKAEVGDGPVRGMIRVGTSAYIASGLEFYRLTSNYIPILLGTITGTGPVSLADNGTQIFIACNPDGFIYNISTGIFAEITDPDFPGAVTVGYLDGYFVFNEPDSQKFWVTSLLDGTSIDPLEFASAEGNPDDVSAIAVDHREAWIFGENSVEVFYNSGSLDFPLARIQGAFLEVGCLAPHSIARLDNSLFWLGSDARGVGTVYRANGYAAQRISDHSIESIIQAFPDISQGSAYTYQQAGHSFYVLNFPTQNRTFVFDVATGIWHERAGYSDLGEFTRHRGNSQMVFNNEVHVGDFENGNVYTLDLETYSDNGGIQKWLRSWRALPTGTNTLKRLVHHQLQLDCEAGVGLTAPQQGDEALVMLRWSDDGGHTWSNSHWATLGISLGAIGDTSHRVIWRRLGMSRDRVYEISGTDPVKIAIMGAELQATGTRT
jgi:hypothetical protein